MSTTVVEQYAALDVALIRANGSERPGRVPTNRAKIAAVRAAAAEHRVRDEDLVKYLERAQLIPPVPHHAEELIEVGREHGWYAALERRYSLLGARGVSTFAPELTLWLARGYAREGTLERCRMTWRATPGRSTGMYRLRRVVVQRVGEGWAKATPQAIREVVTRGTE